MNNHPIYPYPDTLVSAAETRQEHTPVTPLPNPGEGGPVYDGSEPAIPLPNPGEEARSLMAQSLLSLCQIPEKEDRSLTDRAGIPMVISIPISTLLYSVPSFLLSAPPLP